MKAHRNRAVLLRVALLTLSILVLAPHASATRRFCTDIGYNFSDHLSGQPLGPGGIVFARHAWIDVWRSGQLHWSGYTDAVGCTPYLAAPAGQYTVRTYPALNVNGSIFWVYPNDGESWAFGESIYNFPFVSTSQVTHIGQVGYPHGNTAVFNVAALLTRVAVGSDWGIKPGTYKIYAQQNCPPNGISCFATNAVYLGWDPALGQWDHMSRSVIGHEVGHFVQHRLFGSPNGQTAYCHSVPTGNNNLCRCDHVLVPGQTPDFCGGTEYVDRLHCLQSRETASAAIGEGWGHFYATLLTNTYSSTQARFAYYKRFKRMDLQVVNPPVSHDPRWETRWMEVNCNQQMVGLGTEIDWTGFLFNVYAATTNRYSFSNFETLFKSSAVCNGSCTGKPAVTWPKLDTGVGQIFSSAKANFWHSCTFSGCTA